MKVISLAILAALSTLLLGSCRKKEVFPDLAKQMEGQHPVNRVSLVYYAPNSSRTTDFYNPTDSAQIGQVTIRKVDALRVNVELLLRRQTGQVLFEDNFDCELSRDINNQGWIIFNTYGTQAGAYIVDNGSVGYNYMNIGSRTQHGNQVSNVAASFYARF